MCGIFQYWVLEWNFRDFLLDLWLIFMFCSQKKDFNFLTLNFSMFFWMFYVKHNKNVILKKFHFYKLIFYKIYFHSLKIVTRLNNFGKGLGTKIITISIGIVFKITKFFSSLSTLKEFEFLNLSFNFVSFKFL